MNATTLQSVELGVLRPLGVRQDGAPVTIPGARPRAMFTTLGLHSGLVGPADTLPELFWGETLPGTAANAPQAHICSPGRALGDAIALIEAPGWKLAETEVDASSLRLVARMGRDATTAGENELLPDGLRGACETRWIEGRAPSVLRTLRDLRCATFADLHRSGGSGTADRIQHSGPDSEDVSAHITEARYDGQAARPQARRDTGVLGEHAVPLLSVTTEPPVLDSDLVSLGEFVEQADREAALARFDGLSRPARRLGNAADRVAERFLRGFVTADWGAITDGLCHDGRRRTANADLRRGRRVKIASLESTYAPSSPFGDPAFLSSGDRVAGTPISVVLR